MKTRWVLSLPLVLIVVWGMAANRHAQDMQETGPEAASIPTAMVSAFSPSTTTISKGASAPETNPHILNETASPPVTALQATRERTAQEQPDNDECFDCHDDETLTMDRGGRTVSLHVDPAAYAASAHSRQACLDCHVGFDPDEEPHRETIEPVQCAACHAAPTRAFNQGGHAADVTCAACHGDTHAPPARIIAKQTCGRCHGDALDDVQASAHAVNGAGPGCLDCHTTHAVEAVNSAMCLSCHGQKEFVHDHIIHEDLDAILAYQESIHGDVAECSDCHTGHRVLPASDSTSTVARLNITATCADCHSDVAETFLASEHSKAIQQGIENAPTCTDCHGEHDIHQITDSDSQESRAHEIEVCQRCHLDTPQVRDRMTRSSAFIASYAQSIHGRAAETGDQEAATCSDCHGAHEALKASNPDSKVNQFNLTATCGACHQDIQTAFAESIHGEALLQGVADAPTCTSCHGEHAILERANTASPVAARNVSQQVCSPCHSSVKLSEKYGFPSDRLETFGDSYHGLAGQFGSEGVANCASCHGVHDILPSTDPRSKVHKTNLEVTCGQCHPGATANFARGTVHVILTPEGDRLLYWISSLYALLIVVVVGLMALHNGLDWGRKLIERYRARLAPPPAPSLSKTTLHVRMTRGDRLQHALLVLSFILLVITGFMLKYPEAWWVLGLRKTVGEALFDLRGLVHRIAAVMMVGVSVYHLSYVLFTARGRQFFRDILLRLSDLKEMIQMLKYNLGFTRQKPRFDRFNYVEKIEYWALLWGTVIMTATGVALWFENQFINWFSKLFVDVSETIHYFEAWLAFLAIIVWHLYYVLFNPDVYPMNFTWLTGTLTEEEMEREHPRELERIKEAEEEEAV